MPEMTVWLVYQSSSGFQNEDRPSMVITSSNPDKGYSGVPGLSIAKGVVLRIEIRKTDRTAELGMTGRSRLNSPSGGDFGTRRVEKNCDVYQ